MKIQTLLMQMYSLFFPLTIWLVLAHTDFRTPRTMRKSNSRVRRELVTLVLSYAVFSTGLAPSMELETIWVSHADTTDA